MEIRVSSLDQLVEACAKVPPGNYTCHLSFAVTSRDLQFASLRLASRRQGPFCNTQFKLAKIDSHTVDIVIENQRGWRLERNEDVPAWPLSFYNRR